MIIASWVLTFDDDDETQMLKLFLDAYGGEGTSDAIKVFQQHRSKKKQVLTLHH